MTSETKSPRLIDVIMCDDVRREDNGKLLVIGMYLENVQLARVPSTIASLLFLCKWAGADTTLPTGSYSVLDGGGQVLNTITVPSTTISKPRDKALVALAFRPFTFSNLGEYRLTFSPLVGRTRTLASFTVSQKAP